MNKLSKLVIATAALAGATDAGAADSFYAGLPNAVVRAAESATQAGLETLKSGQRSDWVGGGGDQGFGYVKPLRTWKSVSGHWCRRYEEQIYTARGESRRRELVACRVDGRWIIEEA